MRQTQVKINWTAALVGCGVDWAFSLPAGLLVSFVLLSLRGMSLDAEVWPQDVLLASNIVGVLGALLGGGVAGYMAGRQGALHGFLASMFSLFASFCWLGVGLNLGDLGFIILNVVGAAYGGRAGERFRALRERPR